MQILSGKTVAAQMENEQRVKCEQLAKSLGRKPGLAVVLIGDNPASEIYVRNKLRACEKVGIKSFAERVSAAAKPDEAKSVLRRLVCDEQVDGILLQLPLPQGFVESELTSMIPAEKDADGFHPLNLGNLWAGLSDLAPCTPAGVIALLKHYCIPIAGKYVVVIGRSQIVGRPMAELLLREDATVTICHSRTRDLRAFTNKAEIVVVAAGRPEFLGHTDFAKGAVVVDVGIHKALDSKGESRIVGDVKREGLENVLSALSPVPGGVGPMTIAMLISNTLELAGRKKG